MSTINPRAHARFGRRTIRLAAARHGRRRCRRSHSAPGVAARVGRHGHSASVNWATATSAKAGGGMAALVAAAKAEGKLNVITLPSNWANYGTIMKAFTKKYGIKINDAIPDGSSAQEIQAIEHDKGRSDAPTCVDIGQSFAVADVPEAVRAYKVATWSDIPAGNKAANGDCVNDYGGYVSFGCDKKLVKHCPTTWAQLDQPAVREGHHPQRHSGSGRRRHRCRLGRRAQQRRQPHQRHAGPDLLQQAAKRRQLQQHRLRLRRA